MTLTLGSGPLSGTPLETRNYTIDGPAHRLLAHPHPRRIRAELGGETVVDTTGGLLLHETGILPVFYAPFGDVNAELLTETDRATHCPFKGDARYWTVRGGDRVEENVMWGYPEPLDGAAYLRDRVAVYWQRMDAWYEEDEQLVGHLRDPYHRVDARRSRREVQVRAGDETVARSSRPVLVFETGLPVRAYVPLADVDRDRLTPTETTTACPYKGIASYWTVQGADGAIADGAFAYPEPLQHEALRDHVCFLGEGIETLIDGERHPS